MDFIRKNWSRLSLAFLFFIGGVIAVVAWINNPSRIADSNWVNAFNNTAVLISTLVFFFGMVGVTIVKSMENSKKVVSVIYMAMGTVVTILLLVLIMVANFNQPSITSFVGEKAVESFYQLWVPFIVFGLYPLIKGATRFIEAESVPAKATVAQPAVEPAKEPVAEVAEAPKAPKTPKTTAKKAAPKASAAK